MFGVISRKKARVEKEAVEIPEDVTVEILKRLPVKSLLRFRCVGRTWYSLISDPEFYNKLHPKRAFALIWEGLQTLVTIESSLKKEKTPIRSTPLSLPWKPESEHASVSIRKFLGPCNGFVCVNYWSGMILWNPSTRKFTKLRARSRPAFHNSFDQNMCPGFGYDESVDDYKFVWMTFRDGYMGPYKRITILFNVFSFKSKTWSSHIHHTSLEKLCTVGKTGVLINGAIHWVTSYQARDSSGIRILAFDLASDNFRLLESPQECGLKSSVVSLSGCLCLSVIEDSQVDLWMMKDYGVDSSWLKLVSIPTRGSIFHRTSDVSTFHPILFSDEEGKIVAVIEHGYGMREHEIMILQVEEGAVVKAETLFSARGYGDYVVLPID